MAIYVIGGHKASNPPHSRAPVALARGKDSRGPLEFKRYSVNSRIEEASSGEDRWGADSIAVSSKHPQPAHSHHHLPD